MKKNANIKKMKQSGFTILELMIATMVFSTILLLCTYGIIKIGNTYYKGGVLVRTQNATRKSMDAIASTIQYGGDELTGNLPTSASTNSMFCVGTTRFRYHIDNPAKGANHALQLEKINGDCLTAPATSSKELLGENMRLTNFTIAIVHPSVTAGDTDTVKIDLSVGYGDDDVFQVVSGEKRCKGGPESRFCAVSNYSTTVQRRL